MKISYWPDYRSLNSDLPYSALLDSLSSNGYTLEKQTYDADAAVIWSVLWQGRMSGNRQVWQHYRAQNKPVIVIEVGSIQRDTTWKVALNGINQDAYFGPVNNNNTRSKQLKLDTKPWRSSGEYILICGQHEKSLQWQNMPTMNNWVTQTIKTVKCYTDRNIVIRPHPRCPIGPIENQFSNVYREHPVRLFNTNDNFAIDFDQVHFTVNWSSNPGIHSVINGVPVNTGPSSLVASMSTDLSMIENPKLPNRQQWINDYAWTEFTVDEISDGLPISRLKSKLTE